MFLYWVMRALSFPLCFGANGQSIMQESTSSHQPHSEHILPLKMPLHLLPAAAFVMFENPRDTNHLCKCHGQSHGHTHTHTTRGTSEMQVALQSLLCEWVPCGPSFFISVKIWSSAMVPHNLMSWQSDGCVLWSAPVTTSLSVFIQHNRHVKGQGTKEQTLFCKVDH